MTEAEILERNAGAIRALDEVAEMGDEEEQRATLEALMTAIDEEPLTAWCVDQARVVSPEFR